MMPDVLTLALAPDAWPTFALIATRLGGLMLVAPVWSASAIPRLVRVAVTVLLSLLLLPLAPRAALPDSSYLLPLLLALELTVGVVIGLTAAVLVQGITLAGEVISLQMGISLGPALSPAADIQVAGIGEIHGTLALFIYLSVGGHLILLRGVAESLREFPPGTMISMSGGAAQAAALIGMLFLTALRTAAPVMLTLLLTNIGMALLHRAVPNLNTMMVAIPLTVLVGLTALAAALPIVGASIAGWMGSLSHQVDAALQSLGAR